MNRDKVNIKFAKLKDGAVIPSKRSGDAGYDIYAYFEEDMIIIAPNTTVMIPTAIASAFSEDYVMILKERGSSGTKGLGQRAGIIDSNYRGDWIVPLTNHNKLPIVLTDLKPSEVLDRLQVTYDHDRHASYYDRDSLIYFGDKDNEEYNFTIYPKSKAICQALLLPVPNTEIEEITYDELLAIDSDRGCGNLGSSGK